jgi:hypothetical protein
MTTAGARGRTGRFYLPRLRANLVFFVIFVIVVIVVAATVGTSQSSHHLPSASGILVT